MAEGSGGISAGAPDRATVIAELANLSATGEAPAAEPAATPSEAASEKPEAPIEAPAAEPEADEPGEADAAPEKPAEPAVDAETEKRLKTIQAQEKRIREQLAKERSALEAERSEIKARVAELERFQSLAARAKYDPASVLEALGVSADEFESAARHLFARSKAAANDPKWKQASEAAAKEREAQDKISATEKRLAELESRLEKQHQQTVLEQAKSGFFAQVSTAATDDTPLLKSFVAKSPAKARDALFQIAASLYEETGEAPDASDVATAWEKQRRDELAELGLDASVYLAAQKAPPPEATKRPAKTLGAAAGATPARAPVSKAEERDSIIAELRKLRSV